MIKTTKKENKIKLWQDGSLRLGRKKVVIMGKFDKKPIYAYKNNLRLIITEKQ